MYREMDRQISITDITMEFPMKLNMNNRWIRKAELIPWDKIEEKYANMFRKHGKPSKNVRVALGALLIKQELGISDEETVQQIMENPYLQYFIGLKAFTNEPPFEASLMTWFRKRLTAKTLNEINELLCKDDAKHKEEVSAERSDDNNNDDDPPKGGTLVLDATCTPADITYPTDTGLLHKAVELTEDIIDTLHQPFIGKKKRPRTYRRKAQRVFGAFIKKRKPNKKTIRKCIRALLGFLGRNLQYIEQYNTAGGVLTVRQGEKIEAIRKLKEQQAQMYRNRNHSVSDRIVSISQPHVRPIVRGKASAPVEFGAKLAISVVNGYTFVDTLSWDNFNEGVQLKESVEKYRERFGMYPAEILADTIYRNRENRAYCKTLGIRLSGRSLGRPKQEKRQQEQLEKLDAGRRNIVEGKFGESKTKYGLSRIMARLKDTSESVIGIAILAMNLNKRLRSLLCQIFNFYYWRLRESIEICCR